MSTLDPYHVLDADVIVVGAGISGVTTAFALLEKDPSLNIIILEAKGRTGGRTLSKPLLVSKGEHKSFDLGGQWIHSQQKEALDFLSKLEISTEAQNEKGKMIIVYEGKVHKRDKNDPFGFSSVAAKLELANFIAKIEYLCKRQKIDAEVAAMTMEELIDQTLSHRVNKAIIGTMILVNCGVDPVDITVDFYIFFCISTYGIANQLLLNCKGEFRVKNGAAEICNTVVKLLEHDIVVLNNTRVLKIKTTRRDVEIITNNYGTFYSSALVMAIPAREVLKINFSPSLPDAKAVAFGNSIPGILSKFVVTYEEAFWKETGLSGNIHVLSNDPRRPLVCCFDTTAKNQPALTGYVRNGGTTGWSVLEELGFYFGTKAQNPLQFVLQEWSNGSPMFCYKSLQDMRYARQRIDRIFWTGAETSLEWYGSISGAISAANRVAREVIYDLRPASLTVDDMEVLRSEISGIRRRAKTHDDVYKKVMSPYYQVSAIVLLGVVVVLWRKYRIQTGLIYLKNSLIKSGITIRGSRAVRSCN